MSLIITNLQTSLQGEEILHGIDLRVEEGEFISLLGPSGCGKTTLLKSIAGLIEVGRGDICLRGRSLLDVAPEKRGTVIVFQDLRLFPHMTVEGNITFPMALRSVPAKEQREIAARLLDEVQLSGLGGRKIRELSGGQMQRVALARALAAEPEVLLLDEPFSGLDERLRVEMGALVQKIHKERGLTTILVTHDKREALQMSDRILLMKDGKVLQYDAPRKMFFHPATWEVAEYFGEVNRLDGRVLDGTFTCPLVEFEMETEASDGEAQAIVRPFLLGLQRGGLWKIEAVTFMGETAKVEIAASGKTLISQVISAEIETLGLRVGDEVSPFVKTKEIPLMRGRECIG